MLNLEIARAVAKSSSGQQVYLYYHEPTDRFCTLVYNPNLEMYMAEFYIEGRRLYTIACSMNTIKDIHAREPEWEVIGTL